MFFFNLIWLMTIGYQKKKIFRPNSNLEEFHYNAASMWVKEISSWLCLALYAWSLLAPVLLSDREF